MPACIIPSTQKLCKHSNIAQIYQYPSLLNSVPTFRMTSWQIPWLERWILELLRMLPNNVSKNWIWWVLSVASNLSQRPLVICSQQFPCDKEKKHFPQYPTSNLWNSCKDIWNYKEDRIWLLLSWNLWCHHSVKSMGRVAGRGSGGKHYCAYSKSCLTRN